MKSLSIFISGMFLLLIMPATVLCQESTDTRMMTQPAVSQSHIAFIYAEDLWVADSDGSNARRLTIDEGVESFPVFSPDGSLIAFSAQYDGNTDVFVVPVNGGVPKRLTYHPDADVVRDFTPDGKNVVFVSRRNLHTRRYTRPSMVSVEGGQVTDLKIPHAFWASYSDSGSHMAYTPLSEPYRQWKHYRGGVENRIWLFDNETYKVVEIPKQAGGGNDTNPQWMNDKVYFRSDRNGEFNLFSYDTQSKEVMQLTHYTDFPVLFVAANQGKIVFEQAGYLHNFDPNTGAVERIKIQITTDLLELRQRFVSGRNYVRSSHISPSGARVVVDFRGDIITVPAKKGDPKNLTLTQGVHEKYPEWSPDGMSIAYFSDESGEYALHIQPATGGQVVKIPLEGAGFYASLNWSPDSEKLAYVDNARNLFLTDVTTRTTTKIATDELYVPGPFRNLFSDWSFDSAWIAYTVITGNNFQKAYLYSVNEDKSYAVSDGLSNVTEPQFDPSGKYLYMLASTDAGPVVNWFDQSNNDMEATSSIYLATLQEATISPFVKENDTEPVKEEDKKEADKPKSLTIDWAGFSNRIIDVPLGSSDYRNLRVGKEGQLYFIKTKNNQATMMHYDINKRKENEVMPANGFQIAAEGKKVLYTNRGSIGIADLGSKPKDGPVNFSNVRVKIDPKAEWQNIFNETWRVNRDYFYDPNMHGADWPAMKDKYSVFLPHASCKSDLYRIMEWMCSELAVGHHRFGSRGDRMNSPDRIQTGLLGADFVVNNNRYQISKIYGGLNWNPNLRSPLTEPGVNVKEGEYLLAVNGNAVSGTDNLYSFFENTANTITEIRVGPNANGTASRTVNVTPISNEAGLRNRAWVEGNLKKVHEATDGRVAYVYVPNTAGAGHQYFKRYFYPQATKQAVIIDERYNGGGQLADYYIDMLKKPEQAYWNFRYGKDLKSPSASIQGPKVMITDETAGSGGDYLPWMFRKFNLGTIVGKRTWGGLVGVLGYPEFIDGGSVTAPNVAFYTEDGFRVENEGVAPDIEIEQWPEDIINGRDPQLEKAIELVLKELDANPPKTMVRPPYPIRVKQ